MLCNVVSRSNLCRWVARTYFGKTVRRIFEIRPVEKFIHEIIFFIIYIFPVFYRHIGFSLFLYLKIFPIKLEHFLIIEIAFENSKIFFYKIGKF